MVLCWRKKILCLLTSLVMVGMAVMPAFACTTVIVGKDRSADGSVLLAHSEELGTSAAQQLVKVDRVEHQKGDRYYLYSGGSIPQPAVTYAYIASRIFDKDYYPGEFTSGINEYQVSVANNMSWMKGVPEETAWSPALENGVIWTEFTQLALERAKTAREAVALIGELAEKNMLSSDPGTMFAVADPSEGWWVEIARDGQWIARRVEDNAAEMRANSYRIGVVDLEDKENIMHSAALISYAAKKGWYNPKANKPFNFADVYGDPENQTAAYNTLRHQMVDRMLSVKRGLTVADMMNVMRSSYEGTSVFLADEETGSPFHTDNRTVSRQSTEISCVAQLRQEMPAEIGGLIWWNMATARTGVYLPWHFDQATVEAQALQLYKEKGAVAAQAYLTDYSSTLAEQAWQMSDEVLNKGKTEAFYIE